MNIYGLSIPNFLVAILVGIILSIVATMIMTPDYDHIDSKLVTINTVETIKPDIISESKSLSPILDLLAILMCLSGIFTIIYMLDPFKRWE
jgi:hypothetical protein